ncbi:TPA: hypothetical protein MAM37_002044 [Klebsiella pneumoniae]|nr:hypothetical protein [Klebsiella pneumoniae]HCI6857335.1 hypothetical protein [Klebsiella quasipneumoniae subsp. similipneumoniae]
MTLAIKGSGIIANTGVIKIFVSEDEMPAFLGRANLKDSSTSLTDISGAGATFSLTPASGSVATFDSQGALCYRDRGITSDILAPEAVSIYSVHKKGDVSTNVMEAYPFNDGSLSTTAGYGVSIIERSPRGAAVVQYSTGYIYPDASSGNVRITITNSPVAANVTIGDFVFRMLVIDPVAYELREYTGYKGKLYKSVTQVSKDLTLRNRTQAIRFGYHPNSPSSSNSSALRIAEVGVFDGACTDAQAAKAYSDAIALQLTYGIEI